MEIFRGRRKTRDRNREFTLRTINLASLDSDPNGRDAKRFS